MPWGERCDGQVARGEHSTFGYLRTTRAGGSASDIFLRIPSRTAPGRSACGRRFLDCFGNHKHPRTNCCTVKGKVTHIIPLFVFRTRVCQQCGMRVRSWPQSDGVRRTSIHKRANHASLSRTSPHNILPVTLSDACHDPSMSSGLLNLVLHEALP